MGIKIHQGKILRRMDNCHVTFSYRGGSVPACQLRFTYARADSFRFTHRGQLVTIGEYFNTKYSIRLRSPTARLVALDGPESGDFNEGDFYPGELLLLC
ncbi:unnamed protein product [Caenorhabditis brenneri]